MSDEAANLATVIATVIGILLFLGGLWRHFWRGYRLVIEIIPPSQNRRNKSPLDRHITVSVLNQGNEDAHIGKLELRTVKSGMFFHRETTNKAVFDDTTPWKPACKLSPGETKIYDLSFFDGWTKGGNPPENIEALIYLRGVKRPVVASIRP